MIDIMLINEIYMYTMTSSHVNVIKAVIASFDLMK